MRACNFFRMSAMIKNWKVIISTDDQRKSISASLTETLYDSDCEIRRRFLPIEIHDCPWVLFLMERKTTDDGSEERVLSLVEV